MRQFLALSFLLAGIAANVQPGSAEANNSPPCPGTIAYTAKSVPSGFSSIAHSADWISTSTTECSYKFIETMDMAAVTFTSPGPSCTISAATAKCTDAAGKTTSYTCSTRVSLAISTPPPAGMATEVPSLAFDKVLLNPFAAGGTQAVKCIYKQKVFAGYK